MTVRYVYLDLANDNEVLWGPGPMPYFIQLADGDKSFWEITAHSVEESEAKGIFVVEQFNVKNIDPRFEITTSLEFEIIDGRPRETWYYEYIPAARKNMLLSVDEYAEKLRDDVATKYAGQWFEYQEAYREALEVEAIPLDQDLDETKFPYLKADVGVTFSDMTYRIVSSIREAAELVLYKRRVWVHFGANLREARLQTKKRIRDAVTNDEALIIHNEFVSKNYSDYLFLIELMGGINDPPEDQVM